MYRLLTKFSRKDGLVVDGLLCEGHNVVYVLWGGDPNLLALLIEPKVGSSGRAAHVGAATHGAELGDGAVHQVDVLEEVDG